MNEQPDVSFPKSRRLLRPSEFREVYNEGFRVTGPYFAAFCRKRADDAGPRIGFTTPRALGKAVIRNRVKRRLREAMRLQLWRLEASWDIVVNPRRATVQAEFPALAAEVERLLQRCARS